MLPKWTVFVLLAALIGASSVLAQDTKSSVLTAFQSARQERGDHRRVAAFRRPPLYRVHAQRIRNLPRRRSGEEEGPGDGGDRSRQNFELSGVSDTDKANRAKMIFLKSQQTNEAASIKIVNLKTGNVVFAYSVNKTNSIRGKQSAGEAVAKHINEKIENRYH